MTAEELDAQFAALDGQLAKLADTPEGMVRAEHLGADVQRLARLYAADATRAEADALLKSWSEGDDPLRKGIAQHWVERAKAIVQDGGKMPAGAEANAAAAKAMARPRHPAFVKRSERKQQPGDHRPVTT